MYRACIRQGKRLPDFARTSEHSVWVTLHGEIQDPEFLRYLEEIGHERMAAFSTEDFLVLDLIRREQRVPSVLTPRVPALLDHGVIERVGRGRGTRYLLSRRFYRFLGRPGVYTRRKGLDRETNKSLLVRHIEESTATGTTLGEIQDVLPGLSRNQVQGLLRALRDEGRIRLEGQRRWARWLPAPAERRDES
jgi:ATP-dependent DNA helicase RecG